MMNEVAASVSNAYFEVPILPCTNHELWWEHCLHFKEKCYDEGQGLHGSLDPTGESHNEPMVLHYYKVCISQSWAGAFIRYACKKRWMWVTRRVAGFQKIHPIAGIWRQRSPFDPCSFGTLGLQQVTGSTQPQLFPQAPHGPCAQGVTSFLGWKPSYWDGQKFVCI